jgi:hypothetical protein
MTGVLRATAFMIALAGVLDPTLARQQRAPAPVRIHLPAEDDPDFGQASAIRDALVRGLGREAGTSEGDAPRAIVAIGNVALEDADVPVFSIAIPRASPSVCATKSSPSEITSGQKGVVSARFNAVGMRGATTDFVLSTGAARLGQVHHVWSQDAEDLEVRFDFTPPRPGVSVARISAAGGGAPPAHVDVPIVARARRFRALVYEPRPSWSASFVRQALEASDVFDPSALARTSRGISTHTVRTEVSLPSDLNALDAVIVSGLDALTAADEARLETFVRVRGGALILVPDERLPQRLVRTFELPAMDESLLERPAEIEVSGAGSLRGSELLLTPAQPEVKVIATVTQGAGKRGAIFAIGRGNGQVIVSGLLDAWRFRGSAKGGFDAFWQGLVADAAGAAPPALDLRIEPALAHPGETVTLQVNVRPTEWTTTADAIGIPSASATLVALSGTQTPVRLWAGTRAGEYLTHFSAPAEGRYDIRVSSGAVQSDAVLIVDRSISSPAVDRTAALRFLADSTGGRAVSSDRMSDVVGRLRAMDRPVIERRVHPMRSPWWIIPFAGLLAGEWTLRRRRGQP